MRLVSQKMCCPRAYTPQRQATGDKGDEWERVAHQTFTRFASISFPCTPSTRYVCIPFYVRISCLFLSSNARVLEEVEGGEGKGSAVSFVILNFSESLVSCRLNFHRRKTKHPFGGFMQMPRILKCFCS